MGKSKELLLAEQIIRDNPNIGTRAVAKEVAKTYKNLNQEVFAVKLRKLKVRQKIHPNVFEEALKEAKFDAPDNWEYGWLKQKEASVFVRNNKGFDIDAVKDAVKDAVNDAVKDYDWGKISKNGTWKNVH